MTDIRITVNDQIFTAQLADNPTAHDLIDQLPLTLRFRDFNHVEKIAKLPRPLTMDGGSRRRRPRDQRHRLLRSLGRSGSLLRRCRLLERDRTDRSTQRPGHEPHRTATRRVRTDNRSRLNLTRRTKDAPTNGSPRLNGRNVSIRRMISHERME